MTTKRFSHNNKKTTQQRKHLHPSSLVIQYLIVEYLGTLVQFQDKFCSNLYNIQCILHSYCSYQRDLFGSRKYRNPSVTTEVTDIEAKNCVVLRKHTCSKHESPRHVVSALTSESTQIFDHRGSVWHKLYPIHFCTILHTLVLFIKKYVIFCHKILFIFMIYILLSRYFVAEIYTFF